MREPVIETTAEEIGTAIVRRERSSEVLKPLDPETLLASFEEYQKLLQRLLTAEDWQGRPNAEGAFVKKSGWRKIATAFDLDVALTRSEVTRDPMTGAPLRAEAVARATSPKGRSMDGDGYCSADEPRFRKDGGRQKLENDLRATATTRAMNRAIAGLVGMGAVSAEEVDSFPSRPTAGIYGSRANDGQVKQTRAAVAYVLGFAGDVDELAVTETLARVTEETAESGLQEPYLPYTAFRGICLVAAALKERTEAAGRPHEDDPAVETAEERAEREEAERGEKILKRMPDA